MTASQIASIITAAVGILVIAVLAARSGHYIRTGRWFRR